MNVQGRLDIIQDKLDIIDAVNAIFIYTDERDWKRVKDAFTEEVFHDYSSLGFEAATLSRDVMVEGWQGFLPGFEATQHSISNHVVQVNEDEATCFSHGTALHYLPNDSGSNVWRVVGRYRHHLVRTQGGWKASQRIFTLKFVDGNEELLELAQERAAQLQAG